jgi:hypothetical protein
VTGSFLEGLRLYPRLPTVPKVSTADATVLTHTISEKPGESGVPVHLALAKGTHIKIDITGMSLNSELLAFSFTR